VHVLSDIVVGETNSFEKWFEKVRMAIRRIEAPSFPSVAGNIV
jgi:hypothetical protein